MPDQHASISPSSFKRVRLCPASYKFAQQFQTYSTNAAAEEGTALHEAVEHMLDFDIVEPGYVTENGITLTAEHISVAEDVATWVLNQGFEQMWLEERMPIGKALGLNNPDLMWGTSDQISLKEDELWIVDYKFGFIDVDPKGNDQALCYLTGALYWLETVKGYDLDKIKTYFNVIIQPKAGGVKIAEVYPKDMDEIRNGIRQAVSIAMSDDAPFNPGEEQCRFCPAAGKCEAQAEWLLGDDFDIIDEAPEIEGLPATRIAQILQKDKAIRAFLDSVKAKALMMLSSGQQIPGFKRVQGQARARYIDDDEVIEACQDAGLDLDVVAPRKPIAQSYMKKHLGKDVVESLIERPQGAITIAPISDSRKALDSDFDVIDD